MNKFNTIEHYKALKTRKAEIEAEMKAIEAELREIAGTKENPTIIGCFSLWVTEAVTTSYNKALVEKHCPEAIQHGTCKRFFLK